MAEYGTDQEQNNNPTPEVRNFETSGNNLEDLLDLIAEALIQSSLVNTLNVQNNQKFIRNGQLQTGQGAGVLALFQKDIKANSDDLNTYDGDGETTLRSYAEQISNIFELLPSGDQRQSRIIRFFQELNTLLPPSIDDSDWDSDNNGMVDREEGTNNWEGANQYSQDNSISYAQDNEDGNIDEEDAFIHRLTGTANDTNSTKTIEEIYNRVRPYLRDILEDPSSPQDDRPEYENQSSGYLQFRNLNQGIIIRNTNQDFIEGLLVLPLQCGQDF